MRLCEIALVRLCDNALAFVNRDFYGSATRLCPIPPNRDKCCHDGWPEEQAEQAESFQPAQNAEENPKKGEMGGPSNHPRPDKVISYKDHDNAKDE